MKTVTDSTDKKHIGDLVDEWSDTIVFADGETMQVEKRLNGGTILANSNYVVFLTEE